MHPKFDFDEVLVWVSQKTVFERIGLSVVNDALKGINGTIFAYGQTGSGTPTRSLLLLFLSDL